MRSTCSNQHSHKHAGAHSDFDLCIRARIQMRNWGWSGFHPPPPPHRGKSQSCMFPQEYWYGPPWKITKLPSQNSVMGHHRLASEAPFKWCFTGGPTIPTFSYIKTDTEIRTGPLTKLSGSAHGFEGEKVYSTESEHFVWSTENLYCSGLNTVLIV